MEGHTDEVHAVAVTPDGKQVISGSWDGSLRVWDIENGQMSRSLGEGKGKVYTVVITPDGKKAVSGGVFTPVCVWDLQNGQLLHSLEGQPDLAIRW